VTFVIVHSAVKANGRFTCQAVEVQALALVLCASAFLLGNGLLALIELFDGLQYVMLAELFSAVVLGALPAQEQAALLAVVCRLAILIALLAHELRLPHPHALRFNPRQQHKV